jgi:hypothetical protein
MVDAEDSMNSQLQNVTVTAKDGNEHNFIIDYEFYYIFLINILDYIF